MRVCVLIYMCVWQLNKLNKPLVSYYFDGILLFWKKDVCG